MRGNERVELSLDPPPELVIEIEIATSSLAKDEIYANLGVLEVWRYDWNAFRIGLLQAKEVRGVQGKQSNSHLDRGCAVPIR